MEKVEERHPVVLENEGQKLFGVLHLPNSKSKKFPAVLFCHGIAGHKTGKHRAYVDLAYQLSSLGIASLRFDYRGCGDSEGHFHEITPSCHYSDAKVFLEYILSHPEIDTSRVGIFGRSFGGAVAVRVAAECDSIKSLALWCPMFSGEQWQDQWQLVQTSSVDEEKIKEMMQVESQQGSHHFFEEFFSINVSNDLEKLHTRPLLHIHGEVDTRVDIQHAIDYESCRKEASGESRFIRYPQSDHDFSHLSERMEALKQTITWFSNTL